jgi:putative flippase GtrA
MKSFIETLLHNVLVRFVVVGGSVAVIQLAMLYGLHTKLHLPSLTASIIAFIISVFINFGLQKFWSFKDPSKNTIATQFGYFALNALGNLVINIACMYIGVSLLHINTYIMQPLTLALIALCNFFIYKIIFRYTERKEKIHDVSLKQMGISLFHAGRHWAGTFTGRAIITIAVVSMVAQVSAAFGLYTLEQRHPDFDHNLLAIPVIGQDSPDFFHLAHHMRTEHIFSVDGIKPETFRTPGYPLFLALTGNGWVSVVFSILITVATAILVFCMARRMLPFSQQRWAIVAGMLYALAPSVIFHGVVLDRSFHVLEKITFLIPGKLGAEL